MHLRERLRHLVATAALAASVVGPAAQAGDAYPNRPIELIVAYAPGGPGDVAARLVEDAMAKDLGQSLVVTNLLGAGGAIGFSKLARAKPDGYTIGLYQTSGLTAGILQKNAGYDPTESFQGIGMIGELPFYLLSATGLPNDPKTAISGMRANPGKFTYASGGIGSGSHIMGEQFKRVAQVDLLHVPYKGGSEQMRALMAHEAHYTVTPLAGIEEMVKSGKILALASSASQRSPSHPEIPTFAELGMPKMTVVGWVGMIAPRGTPDAIVNRLRAALDKALADPQVRERLKAQSLDPKTSSSPQEFDRYIRTDTERWREMIRAGDIRME